MTLRHMKIFLAVTEHGCNTTKAAQALMMSQPAVSLAVRELEQYYGVVLFDRIGRRLRITEAGLRFQDYASHICSLFDDMEKGMRGWDVSGQLRAGASITIGSQFLPAYVRAFRALRPEIQIRALVAPSDLLEKRIMENELDFALIEGVTHNPALCAEEYMDDCLTVICPDQDFFRQNRKMSLQTFQKQCFLLRERGSGTREVIDRVTENAGFLITPMWEAMSTTALINAVINGLGISILPHRMVAEAVRQGLVIAVSVEGLEFRRRFRIIYHKEKYLTQAAKEFLELCRSFDPDHPRSGSSMNSISPDALPSVSNTITSFTPSRRSGAGT